MENNKILLFAVLIILLALVAFNFKNFTGKVSHGAVTIDISPDIVDCRRYDSSKIVNVFVDAGSLGIDRNFYLYRAEDGTRVGGSSDDLCTDDICTGMHSVNYRLSCGLDSGEYFFKFERENYGTEYESPIFTLVHSG